MTLRNAPPESLLANKELYMTPTLLFNTVVLSQVDAAVNQQSVSVDISEASGFAVHAVFTGSPNGQLKIMGSNDASLGFGVIQTQSISSSGSVLLNVQSAHYTSMRVEYVATSGSGTLSARVSGKSLE